MGFEIESLDTRETALVCTVVLAFAINWIAWIFGSAFKTEKFYDLTGSITFVVINLFSLINAGHYHARQIVFTAMVLVWTVRLGGFLFYRALVMGGDSRFEEAKQSFSSFFVYWSVQALWAWICSLPVTLVNSHERNPGLHWSDVVGVVLFVFGFLMESTADFQKFAFKRNPENKGKFVTVGLWKYARYPQYFAEIVLWWGIFVAAAHDLRNWEFVAVASPLFVMYLLLVLSGIPVQEKQAKQRWGSNPEYLLYKETSNLLVPIPKFWRPKPSEIPESPENPVESRLI